MKSALVQQHATGIFEEGIKVADFQNGYFIALVNRVEKENILHFAGESLVVDPLGQIIAQAPQDEDYILYTACDLKRVPSNPARKYFIPDRGAHFYPNFRLLD